jgi:hypothetical protein
MQEIFKDFHFLPFSGWQLLMKLELAFQFLVLLDQISFTKTMLRLDSVDFRIRGQFVLSAVIPDPAADRGGIDAGLSAKLAPDLPVSMIRRAVCSRFSSVYFALLLGLEPPFFYSYGNTVHSCFFNPLQKARRSLGRWFCKDSSLMALVYNSLSLLSIRRIDSI